MSPTPTLVVPFKTSAQVRYETKVFIQYKLLNNKTCVLEREVMYTVNDSKMTKKILSNGL